MLKEVKQPRPPPTGVEVDQMLLAFGSTGRKRPLAVLRVAGFGAPELSFNL